MKLTKKEAKALSKVLNEGMPHDQCQRDFIASIDYKLRQFLK